MSEVREFEFQIDGIVTIRRLRDLLDAWDDTFSSLQTKLGKDQVVSNHVSDLSGGSAAAACIVEFSTTVAADEFSRYYYQVGIASQYEDISHLPKYISKPAKKLRKAIPRDVEEGMDGVVWRSPASEQLLQEVDANEKLDSSLFDDILPQATPTSYGVLEGRLEALNSHQGLEARIYDSLFSRAVKISLNPSDREKIRELWDKKVTVQGVISRDVRSGVPLRVLDIDAIAEVVPHGLDPWAWKDAAGVLEGKVDDLPSEKLIRKIWDEEDLY